MDFVFAGFARDGERGAVRAGDDLGVRVFVGVARCGGAARVGLDGAAELGRVTRLGVFVRSPTLGLTVGALAGAFRVGVAFGDRGSTRALSRATGWLFGATSTVRVVRTGSIEGRLVTSCRAFSRVVGSRCPGVSSTVRVVRTGSMEGRLVTSCRAFSRVVGSRWFGVNSTVRVVRTGSM
ncbi:MAG: hypothetical protein KJO44_02195, partial [Gemmatimonadetes bacterium]|nr:hypothetical protein [Gemmatimonadota bacterium]